MFGIYVRCIVRFYHPFAIGLMHNKLHEIPQEI